MDRQKIIDASHEIADTLEHEASVNRVKEEARIKAYYEGYVDACEAFGKRIRKMVYEEPDQ